MINNLNLPKDCPNFSFSPEIIEILDAIKNTKDNLNILGSSGTGKTSLLKLITANPSLIPGDTVILSSTGIASFLASSEGIQGSTVHSFFNIKPLTIQTIETHSISDILEEMIQHVDTIIIDEISMLNCALFDLIIQILRKHRYSIYRGLPRILLFGDIFQLPPVMDKKDSSIRKYFHELYDDKIMYFNSYSFKDYGFKTFLLKTIYRQKEKDFQTVLNKIRIGQQTNADLEFINQRVISEEQFFDETEGFFSYLVLKNKTVDEINNSFLHANEYPLVTYYANIQGKFNRSKKAYLHEVLNLKKEMKVMCLKNNKSLGYCNGLLGVVTELGEKEVIIESRGIEYPIQRETWTNFDYEFDEKTKKVIALPVGTFSQIALQSAYAFTVHKAQGQQLVTYFDKEEGAFDCGITYVALSRAPSLKELALKKPIEHSDIMVNKESLDFLESL